ncbi:hypothetical protein RTP6_005029 [Batrachochytrium dendrobatidis]
MQQTEQTKPNSHLACSSPDQTAALLTSIANTNSGLVTALGVQNQSKTGASFDISKPTQLVSETLSTVSTINTHQSLSQSAHHTRSLHSHPQLHRASSTTAIKSSDSAVVSTAIPGISFSVDLITKAPSANKFATSSFFAALEEISESAHSPFEKSLVWKQLLQSSIPPISTAQDAFDLDSAAIEIACKMSNNNHTHFNFNTLVLYLLTKLKQMRNLAYEGDWPVEAHNAMFAVRIYTKHFVETLSKRQVLELFEHDRIVSPDINGPSQILFTDPQLPIHSPTNDNPSSGLNVPSSSRPARRSSASSDLPVISIDPRVISDKRKRSLALLEELLHVVIYANTVTASGYEFYLETINLLLVLLSTQLTHGNTEATENDLFLQIVLQNLGHFSKGMLGRLLENFINQQSPPAQRAGVFYNAYSMLFSSKDHLIKSSPLAEKSILLLMTIAGQGACGHENDFRKAFAALEDSSSRSQSPSTILSEMSTNPMQMPFKSIYHSIIKYIQDDETCLLLYMLLLKNRQFRMYVLSRTDPDVLMLPLLHLIYEAVEKKTNYSQLYILLTILLILSQDDVHNENSHKVTISPPAWFTERIIRFVTLGDLVMLILIRVIQANISRHRDIYFHTTSLAILANMSSTIIGMHSVVAQRLVNLYELISKKYSKLSKQAEMTESSPTLSLDKPNHDGVNTEHDVTQEMELAVYSDLIALLLEIINSVLTHTLKSNQQLVYALLHRRAMFSQFRLHARFSELIQNIDTVIAHFHGRLIEADLRTPSVDDILKLIDETGLRWAPGNLKEFPDVKFQYEEETEYQKFFVPYIWSLVYQHAHIYWNPTKAVLLYLLDPDFQISHFTGSL